MYSIPQQRTRRLIRVLLVLLTSLIGLSRAAPLHAQGGELVASLETKQAKVLVKRVDTDEWVLVRQESLIGVGDSIRTDASGDARITFFVNGTETEVLPDSEIRIDQFTGVQDQYQLSLTVVIGQTRQRIEKLLESGSSYQINSAGLELAVRGTVLSVRVEPNGRSATIVQEGIIKANGKGDTKATSEVPAGYGVRAEPGKAVSDVVAANSFAELDAALDGCNAVIDTLGDVRLNVRTGPGLNFERVGYFPNKLLQRIYGVTETTKWYRIQFRGGYAWLFAPALKLAACAGLRKYPDNYGPEDTSLYTEPAPTLPAISATPIR